MLLYVVEIIDYFFILFVEYIIKISINESVCYKVNKEISNAGKSLFKAGIICCSY